MDISDIADQMIRSLIRYLLPCKYSYDSYKILDDYNKQNLLTRNIFPNDILHCIIQGDQKYFFPYLITCSSSKCLGENYTDKYAFPFPKVQMQSLNYSAKRLKSKLFRLFCTPLVTY